jgi:hypothetical protein
MYLFMPLHVSILGEVHYRIATALHSTSLSVFVKVSTLVITVDDYYEYNNRFPGALILSWPTL